MMTITEELFWAINNRVESIRREIGDYHENKSEVYPTIALDRRVYFTLHISATEGRRLKQHSEFHGRPKVQLPNGLYTGRGWPGLAYSYGSRSGFGIVQAWDLVTVTYHCGPGNYVAIGGMIEGNFELRPPTPDELLDGLAMKIDADNQVGRRLILKYHDEWKIGWKCPGQYWPKDRFAEMERQYYVEKAAFENPVDPEPDPEDPADTNPDPEPDDPVTDQPGTPQNPVGCAVIFLFIEAILSLLIYLSV